MKLKWLRDAGELFSKDIKLFLAMNAAFVGLLVLGALIALAFPQLQLDLLGDVHTGTYSGSTSGLFSPVLSGYRSGNVLYAAAMLFAGNFLGGTLAAITIPSLLFPPWALIEGIGGALLDGITLIVPTPGRPLDVVVPHYGTILIEGEAYLVAIFACVGQIRVFLKIGRMPSREWLKAYWLAIVDNLKLLPIVMLILAVAALYEAWEIMVLHGHNLIK